jgi:hypothetical protein
MGLGERRSSRSVSYRHECVRHATLERYFLTDTYCPSRLPAEKRLTTFLNLTDSKRIDK